MTPPSRALVGPAADLGTASDGGRRPTSIAARFAVVLASIVALLAALSPPAVAQDLDAIIADLEAQGWYIEPGGEGSASDFDALVRRTSGAADPWYFVSLAGSVGADFADVVRDDTRPTGNVIVYFVDNEGFLNVQLASGESESIENQALAPFDDDWATPDEFMGDVVTTFDRLTGSTSTASSGSSGTGSTAPADSGGGAGWLWIVVPVVAIGGLIFFSSRSSKKKAAERQLEMATKMREAIQSELDELANDVLVLSGPVDLSEDTTAIQHYREAAATYTAISDEIPDLDKLADADLTELHGLGVRVSHARWQMDAAEAIIDGEPIPDKPEIEPPPAPPAPPEKPTAQQAPPPAPRMPRREARPRVPYSRTRRRSGGGLLDILIAGGSMMGRSGRRSSGGFGGSSRSAGSTRSSSGSRSSGPRPGGGVFGGGSSSRRSTSRRSTSRTRTRSRSRSSSRSRASSSRRSSSRRRRR